MTIDLQRVRRAFAEKSDAELVSIWRRHDADEWQPAAFEVVKDILNERGVPIPEESQVTRERIIEAPRTDGRVDIVCRWIALIVCVPGVAIFGFGLVTEAPRIARDPLEDGILPGFVYCLLAGLGALRSFRPQLPKWLHQASALVNALLGIAVIMLWVYLLRGALDSGTEFVPVLLTVLYGIMLRATMIEDHFRPPAWLVVIVLTITALFFVSQDMARADASLAVLNRRTDLLGAFASAVVLAWVVLLIAGFWRATPARLEDS